MPQKRQHLARLHLDNYHWPSSSWTSRLTWKVHRGRGGQYMEATNLWHTGCFLSSPSMHAELQHGSGRGGRECLKAFEAAIHSLGCRCRSDCQPQWNTVTSHQLHPLNSDREGHTRRSSKTLAARHTVPPGWAHSDLPTRMSTPNSCILAFYHCWDLCARQLWCDCTQASRLRWTRLGSHTIFVLVIYVRDSWWEGFSGPLCRCRCYALGERCHLPSADPQGQTTSVTLRV